MSELYLTPRIPNLCKLANCDQSRLKALVVMRIFGPVTCGSNVRGPVLKANRKHEVAAPGPPLKKIAPVCYLGRRRSVRNASASSVTVVATA